MSWLEIILLILLVIVIICALYWKFKAGKLQKCLSERDKDVNVLMDELERLR